MKLGVKFCGVMSKADVRKAELVGADAAGVIVRPDDDIRASSRVSHTVDIDKASDLAESMSINIGFVLVPRTGGYEDITYMADETGPDRIQIGHVEDPALIARLRDRYGGTMELAQVIHVGDETKVADVDPFLDEADIIHLDSPGSQPGGNAMTHDWYKSAAIAAHVHEQGGLVILSGGLTVANVARAIAVVKPEGVDAESANRKFDVYNQKMMQEFVDAAV